jgi:hypothetical protein
VGNPNTILPEWDDAAIEEEDWMFDAEDGKKFEDPDQMVHFPAHLRVEEQRKMGSVKEGEIYATATQWLRPSEFIEQPPQPVLTDEETAALAEKKRQEEEEKKKAKGKKPKKGEEEVVVELPPGTVVPCIIKTAEELAWDNLDADAKKAIEANPEGEHPGPPDNSALVPREYARGFKRYWSEKQKDEILVESNMIAAWIQAKQEKEAAKELAKAEAEELGEEWYDDDELMGIVEEDEPQPLERTEEGPEAEAVIASYFRVLLTHSANVLTDDPFLWEAIYPQKNGRPVYNPAGKYAVKVFVAGRWRKLLIDDRIPCDANRTPCFVTSKTKGELWPSLLSKAIYKLINLYGVDLLTNNSLNSTELCALTLHSLAGWLPQVFPKFQGAAGWDSLVVHLPVTVDDHGGDDDDDDENKQDDVVPRRLSAVERRASQTEAARAAAEEAAAADEVAAGEAKDEGAEGAEGEGGEAKEGEGAAELTDEEKAKKAEEEANAKAEAEAEALKSAGGGYHANRTIPLLCTPTMHLDRKADKRAWKDLTSAGEVNVIEEANHEGHLRIVGGEEVKTPMWIEYAEMEEKGYRALLMHTRYNAPNRASLDVHWVDVNAPVVEKKVDEKAPAKGKAKGKPPPKEPEPEVVENPEPHVPEYRPPVQEEEYLLVVDDAVRVAKRAADAEVELQALAELGEVPPEGMEEEADPSVEDGFVTVVVCVSCDTQQRSTAIPNGFVEPPPPPPQPVVVEPEEAAPTAEGAEGAVEGEEAAPAAEAAPEPEAGEEEGGEKKKEEEAPPAPEPELPPPEPFVMPLWGEEGFELQTPPTCSITIVEEDVPAASNEYTPPAPVPVPVVKLDEDSEEEEESPREGAVKEEVEEKAVEMMNPGDPLAVVTFRLHCDVPTQTCSFRVPVGSRKLFRVFMDAPQGYTVTFASASDLSVQEAGAARDEHWDLSTARAEGEYAPQAKGAWGVVFRQGVSVVPPPGWTGFGDDGMQPPPTAGDGDGADPEAVVPESAPAVAKEYDSLTRAWLMLPDGPATDYVRLHLLDNDSGTSRSFPAMSTGWIRLKANETGYTILGTMRCKTHDLPAGKWKLQVAQKRTQALVDGAGGWPMTELAAHDCNAVQHFGMKHVPNRYHTLFRDVVRVGTKPTEVCMRLTTPADSEFADARLKLCVYRLPPDVAPLEADPETGVYPDPVLVQGECVQEAHGRGSVEIYGIPSKGFVAGDPKAAGNAEHPPAQFIIEGTLDSARWEVPKELLSKYPYYRPILTPIGGGEGDADGADAAGDAEKKNNVWTHVTIPKDSALEWDLQVMSVGEDLVVHHDSQKEQVRSHMQYAMHNMRCTMMRCTICDTPPVPTRCVRTRPPASSHTLLPFPRPLLSSSPPFLLSLPLSPFSQVEALKRDIWERQQPGRTITAKISRLKHLVKGDASYTAELMELLAEEEASMAAGGKGAASKKGKDKGSKSTKGSAASGGGIDEEAMKVQAQMARRERLQSVARLPAVLTATGEVTILTPAARAKRDEARRKVIGGFDAKQAAQIRARESAKTMRADAQNMTVAGYKSWRAKSNMQRYCNTDTH